MRPHGILAIANHDPSHVERLAGTPIPIVGGTRFTWDQMRKWASLFNPAQTRLYYRPLHAGEGAPEWYKDYEGLSPDKAAAKWWNQGEKDGDKLDTILKWMTDKGHQPIVQVLNEPWRLLNDFGAIERLSAFSVAVGKRLQDAGAMAAVGSLSTGTINPERVSHMEEMLEYCRAGHAIYEYHEYAPIWVTVWMGQNQSDKGVSEDSPDEKKWAAILKDPRPDFSNPANWRPAWLNGRIWGMQNEDDSFGIPALYDVPLLKGEGEIDTIVDWRLPWQGDHPFGGWYTTRIQVMNRLHVPENEVAVEGFRVMDDFQNRLVMEDGKPHIKYVMAFALGPGYEFENHDIARTGESFNAYVDYLHEQAAKPAPAPLKVTELDGKPEPPEEPPVEIPPEEPPEEEPPTEEPPAPQPKSLNMLLATLAATRELEADTLKAMSEAIKVLSDSYRAESQAIKDYLASATKETES